MARLIVKVKYLKPHKARKVGRYAQYIATREGVEKMEPEEKTYVDYIATRPRAERIGKHGLFSNGDEEIDLKKVSQELNAFPGTIWTAIISMKREDAERLGYDKGERWRNLVRAHADEIANNFGIRQSELKWYGAFHNESYHPHIHLIIYDKCNSAFLGKGGVENLKSIFAHAIFKDEMYFVQNEKSERRDQLRLRGKKEIEEILQRIKEEGTKNERIPLLMVDLAARLRSYQGRKVYGYLRKDEKKLVNAIVDEMEKIPAVRECYDLWYEKQEELSRFYKSEVPKRVPLSANPEFKSIKNAVIRAACELDPEMNEDFDEVIDMNGDEIGAWRDQKQVKRTDAFQSDPIRVGVVVSRLCNNVTHIFRRHFSDNPTHSPRVDRKLRRKIMEKDMAHGIKHE